MALEVGSIVVYGTLRAGSPTCRLTSRLTFTFHPVAGIDPFNMVGWTLPPSLIPCLYPLLSSRGFPSTRWARTLLPFRLPLHPSLFLPEGYL